MCQKFMSKFSINNTSYIFYNVNKAINTHLSTGASFLNGIY